MDLFDKRYYRIQRYLLEFIGQWPYQTPKKRRIRWILLYLAVGTVSVVQVLKIIQLRDNIDVLTECLILLGGNFLSILKSSNCIFNGGKMRRLLDLIKKDWDDMADEEEIRVLTRYVERGGVISSIYGVCVFGTLLAYMTIPLMPQIMDLVMPLNETRQRRLLCQVEYFVDEDEYYVYIMIHTYLGTIMGITACVSTDTMLVAYVHHICGIFTIIGNRLENASKRADLAPSLNGIIENDRVCGYIANCINDHRKAIEFARLIDASYTLTIFLQIAISMLLISVTGFQVVAKIDKLDEAVVFVQSVVAQLVHLFLTSWPSQMLIDHSRQFQDSLYFAEWYRFPLRGRRLLKTAMLRCVKPCKMTAGKCYDLSFQSFVKVVQTSMSYFTVLVSLR